MGTLSWDGKLVEANHLVQSRNSPWALKRHKEKRDKMTLEAMGWWHRLAFCRLKNHSVIFSLQGFFGLFWKQKKELFQAAGDGDAWKLCGVSKLRTMMEYSWVGKHCPEYHSSERRRRVNETSTQPCPGPTLPNLVHYTLSGHFQSYPFLTRFKPRCDRFCKHSYFPLYFGVLNRNSWTEKPTWTWVSQSLEIIVSRVKMCPNSSLTQAWVKNEIVMSVLFHFHRHFNESATMWRLLTSSEIEEILYSRVLTNALTNDHNGTRN